MQYKEYKTVDKSGWPQRGEWDNEPDKVQYVDEETGFPCLIVRNPFGSLCGYVGIKKEHPYFGKDYKQCDIWCHWGLAYSDFCQTVEGESVGVCHLVDNGENDEVWWLGFDCAHSGDISPSMNASLNFVDSRYRNINYVKEQNTSIAQQLKEKQNDQ